ncbi:hypothetical protein M569_02275 [Genlisea aurea]|uniref:Uncharacterized protein n=1 Tax=Genlisea aurea TaxID=192259 RepID=S8EIT1_9LAMI|nr:hypothetical protein M569_02275 [Genlisea aurea]
MAEEKDKIPQSPSVRRTPLLASVVVVVLLLLAGIIVLAVSLIYGPHDPRFRVVSIAVYDLNSTSPPFISTTVQPTVAITNPSRRSPVHYDRLSVFLAYRNQPITPPIVLPPLDQEPRTTVAMSPFLGGSPVPVAADVLYGIDADEDYGVVGLRVVILGTLRYGGVGVMKRGHYGVYVSCDLFVAMRRGTVGQLPLLSSPLCAVHII